ncbi:MAG: DNA-binding domain-containing protein [Gallionella sp.]
MNTHSGDLAQFSSAILGSNLPDANRVGGANYPAGLALAVYRNNYIGNLHDALAGAYPVIEKLVGDAFFRRLTHAYIEQHRSRSGNLHHYGEQMSAFIAAFEPAQQLAYLPDVATLEWACHCAYFADDADTFEIGKLLEIPAERYTDLVFGVHPSSHLLHSRFPVAAIWLAHQPGAPDDFHINIDSGPCVALVVRTDYEVVARELADDEAEWLSRLRQGTTLGVATELTLANHPDFNLPTVLARLVTQGVFCGVSLKDAI